MILETQISLYKIYNFISVVWWSRGHCPGCLVPLKTAMHNSCWDGASVDMNVFTSGWNHLARPRLLFFISKAIQIYTTALMESVLLHYLNQRITTPPWDLEIWTSSCNLFLRLNHILTLHRWKISKQKKHSLQRWLRPQCQVSCTCLRKKLPTSAKLLFVH